jgi:hypothetical protein
VVSPLLSLWKGEPQATLIGQRVKDGGGSEGRSVMERIGPRKWKYPTRKGADFRRVARHERA